MKILFLYAGYENLGIEYLSAVLKKHGHDTSLVFDPQLFDDKFLSIPVFKKIFNIEKLIMKKTIAEKPDLIVFSVVSADYIWACRLAASIKKFKNIPIVFGGIHPTTLPRLVMKNPDVDFVILGEGEHALLELVQALAAGKKKFSDIKNLVYKDKNNIISNPVRLYLANLDQLPFPDKDLYYGKLSFLRQEYTVITRRGCINSCTYCHNNIWDKVYGYKKIRYRSVNNVMQELRLAYKKYHFKKIRINDEIFTCNKRWLREFALKYSREFRVPIWCYVNPSTIDEEMVKLLKKINCFNVTLGIQTINQKARRNILHRNDSNLQIIQAIRLFKKYKIRCITDNLLGIPDQSEKELIDLAEFYLKNPVARICLYWLIYFPGTDIVKTAFKKGLLTKKDLQTINNNPVILANTLKNKYNNPKLLKYNLLLVLYHFLPKPIMKYILEKKIYNRFPHFNPAILEILLMFSGAERKEIEKTRFIKRYLFFILRIPCYKLFNNYFI